MKFKGTQKPSLIILGRTTLALMLLTIAAVSFGAGYLTGYQFTSSSHDDRPVMASTSRMVLPPDEKRVLEPTPPAPAQQPSQSQSQQVSAPPPKQDGQPLISVKPSAPEASAPPAQAEQKTAMAEKPAPAKPVAAPKPEESKKAPVTQVPPAPQAPAAQKPADLKKKLQPGPSAAPKTAEVSAKAAKKKTGAKTHAAATPKKGAYAVQFGAFEEPAKASQLKKDLAAKGIKAYVLPKGKSSSYARVRAGSFAKHEQAVRYAEVCRTKGFEGFITK